VIRRGEGGFALTEMIVAASLVTIVILLATSRWEARTSRLRLRFATVQVAFDLASARDAAKEAGKPLVVTFAASKTDFILARVGAPLERVVLPEGVVAAADATLTFLPLGETQTPQMITLKNPSGVSTIRVAASGSVSYSLP